MHCERCGNADAPYECAMCGFRFCAGCVDLSDHEPRCWECLGIEPPEDEDEGLDEDERAMGVEVNVDEGPFCPQCGYPVNFSEPDDCWDCPRCWASSENEIAEPEDEA